MHEIFKEHALLYWDSKDAVEREIFQRRIWKVGKKISNHPYKEAFLHLVIRRSLLKEQVI